MIAQKHHCKEFALVFNSGTKISAGLFTCDKVSWKLKSFYTGTNWIDALKNISYKKDYLLFVSSFVPEGVFFQEESPKMAASLRKDALYLELPNKLAVPIKDPQLQFAQHDSLDSNLAQLNCAVIPAKFLFNLAEILTTNKIKIDNFIHPLLGVTKDKPAIPPEIIDECGYFNNNWITKEFWDEKDTEKALDDWKEELKKDISFDEDNFKEKFPLLLVASFIIDEAFISSGTSLQIISSKNRPVRFRNTIITTIVLAIILVITILLGSFPSWQSKRQEYLKLTSEIQKLKNSTNAAKRRAKTSSRIQKERQRVVTYPLGDQHIISTLSQLSTSIPESMVVTSLSWTDSSINLTLNGTGEDLAERLRNMKDWKTAQLNQRRHWNNSGYISNVRLVPITSKGDKK